MMEEKNEILSVEDVMARLNLSYRVVLAIIKAGVLPAAKIGKRWRIQSRDLFVMLDREKAKR